ncbi:MAG: LysR family transcriptional regulator [Pseudomonadota bacterium]
MSEPERDKPSLSLRIDLPGGGRFGPGKAALMRAIETDGSIAAAARALSMSYPRALRLVDDMNAQFHRPLVDRYHGGAQRGGARLTELGVEVLGLYEQVCNDAFDATTETRERLLSRVSMTGGAKKD